MGLIYSLLVSIVHLIFVGMDILMVMILIKVIHDRWHPNWLRQCVQITEPLMTSITCFFHAWLSKTTGKSYPEKTCLILLVLGLSFLRLIICSLV